MTISSALLQSMIVRSKLYLSMIYPVVSIFALMIRTKLTGNYAAGILERLIIAKPNSFIERPPK